MRICSDKIMTFYRVGRLRGTLPCPGADTDHVKVVISQVQIV